ncbi:MAG: TauD/TfdA family dioxygenase, partial [Gemmatimonadetes bacterium]|nr:TauD/TfdA family dioxygenase [Gemmatimonadota bacterium]NIT68613.1 TauD/TfdA family dioxygenase [Gemmatimonadota bacterium]NIV25305.1 TauD/TfdA family dioxygenase [Gemmatimonadota bacterium]NIW77329.1 TauD/TfdA family dioxygenase [Gemmatimonadota bacterium]NIY37190.1 TauD/TfdA family dioxygenase [Gemmatimonadota bacterium]
GAEVTGVDLSEGIGDDVAAALREAWLDHDGILVIRGQENLSSEAHIAFARHFGPLFGAPGEPPLQETVSRYIHPEHPEIYRVSNKQDEKGEPLGRKGAGTYWHSDVSFRERPAAASILSAKEIPPIGGDTLFANTYLAYEALSEAMKKLLSPLRAVHDFEVAARTQYAKPVVVARDIEDGTNRAVHPVVRTHEETGRKCLYVNPGFTAGLVGFEPQESKALLDFLYAHCTRPEFVYRHRWQPGDLLIWDNRNLMHYAISDYTEPRHMERTTCIGGRPV